MPIWGFAVYEHALHQLYGWMCRKVREQARRYADENIQPI